MSDNPNEAPDNRWRGSAATAALRWCGHCRAAGEGAVSGPFPAKNSHSDIRWATGRERTAAGTLWSPCWSPCNAPRGNRSKAGQAHDQPRRRRSLPLYSQSALSGPHAGVQRYYHSRQLATFCPAAPPRPPYHATRGDRTRGALSGAHFRRGARSVQDSSPALDSERLRGSRLLCQSAKLPSRGERTACRPTGRIGRSSHPYPR